MMIGESLDMLRKLRDSGEPGIIVGLSAGKDSLTVLDLCSRVFETVHVFFLYFLKGMESEERFLRLAEHRYGISVHRFPGMALADSIRYSRLRECRPELESQVRRDLKWRDIEAIMRQRTGCRWFAYGHRITDTLQRRAMLKSARGVLEKHRRIYPIWNWKARDVFGYIRSRKIPAPPMFGAMRHKTSGLSPFDVRCLWYLKEHYPGDYRKIVQAFPHAESLMFREELRATYEIEQNNSLEPAAV